MTRKEAATLLTLIAAYDRRTLGESDVYAWADALDDIRYVDAVDVVKAHYRNSREWLMPADVRAAVRALRDKRLEGMDTIQPPDDLTPWGGYLPWLRATRKAVADGDPPPAAPELHTRDLRAIDGTFRDVDGAA